MYRIFNLLNILNSSNSFCIFWTKISFRNIVSICNRFDYIIEYDQLFIFIYKVKITYYYTIILITELIINISININIKIVIDFGIEKKLFLLLLLLLLRNISKIFDIQIIIDIKNFVENKIRIKYYQFSRYKNNNIIVNRNILIINNRISITIINNYQKKITIKFLIQIRLLIKIFKFKID